VRLFTTQLFFTLVFLLCAVCAFCMERECPSHEPLLGDVEMAVSCEEQRAFMSVVPTHQTALRLRREGLPARLCTHETRGEWWVIGGLCVVTVALGIMWLVDRFSVGDEDPPPTPLG